MLNYLMICSIIMAICLLIILLTNLIYKKKSIKNIFLVFCLIFLILILTLDTNFVYEFLKSIITYLWYPNYLIFVIIILTSIIILGLSLFKKENLLLKNILNYLLFTICFACYLIFLSLDIDTSLYSSLYQTNSLIVMRIVTISFVIWLLLSIYIRMRGSNEK